MKTSSRRIYLASRSPRRRELLKQAGIAYEVLLYREDSRRGIDVDETPCGDEDPREYVLRMARTKAEVASRRMQQRRLPAYPVLCADTTVVVAGRICGKPADPAQALAMLCELSARSHEVLTAVAVCHQDRIETRLSESVVEFGSVSTARLHRYVASGEPLDKAGAYGIQGRAGAFVKRLSGSYTGVMGLPLFETVELLEAVGVVV